jgi:hypothetical protein
MESYSCLSFFHCHHPLHNKTVSIQNQESKAVVKHWHKITASHFVHRDHKFYWVVWQLDLWVTMRKYFGIDDDRRLLLKTMNKTFNCYDKTRNS